MILALFAQKMQLKKLNRQMNFFRKMWILKIVLRFQTFYLSAQKHGIFWNFRETAIDDETDETRQLNREPVWVSRLRVNFKNLKLSFRQKSAVNHFYLNNPNGRTKKEVAKALRISVYSLTDRLDQVKRKLNTKFPADARDELIVKNRMKKNSDFVRILKTLSFLEDPLHASNIWANNRKHLVFQGLDRFFEGGGSNQ